MPRHCPDCGAQMEDDALHCWCPAAGCTFRGYVVLQTQKILREREPEPEEPCPLCGCEERGQGGYLACECPDI